MDSRKKITILQVLSVDNPIGNGVHAAVKKYVEYESKIANVGILDIKNTLKGFNNCFCCSQHKTITISSLTGVFSSPDIVVFNEIYVKDYIRLYKECLKRGIPYVIIPHGSLKKEAQNNKTIKKTLANLLLFNKFIKKSAAIQFLNEYERDTSVVPGRTKTIIHGNGVDQTKKKHVFPENATITYVGRYSIRIKGLDLLIRSLSGMKEYLVNNNIKVALYGRNTTDTKEDVIRMVNECNLGNIVSVNGPVYGDRKAKVLEGSTLFIQLSRHEGQPMGIIEALSYGVPCVVSYETSFGTILNKNMCGFGIRLQEEEVSMAISTALSDRKRLTAYSRNAISLISSNYLWRDIINDTMRDYEYIIKRANV